MRTGGGGRSSTSKKYAPSGPMPMDPFATGAPSIIGSQPNLYGGYAESIAPSHHSTYAHGGYYDEEDEPGWEMPNFYSETYMKETLHPVNKLPPNGTTNGSALHGISNPNLYGTKEDLYDRLRRHQYTGKKGGE